METPNQPKSRIAIVRISRGEVIYGVQHIPSFEGETDEQIFEKVREKISGDEFMPQDVELKVVDFEDFQPEVIQVHKFPKDDAMDTAIRTKSDPVKFETERIEGNFDQVEDAIKGIIQRETFIGIESIFGQRVWASKSGDKWMAIIISKRKLTSEELAEEYSGNDPVEEEKDA